MREPDVSMLARRLAEENNVNWRELEGSGPGGQIVERDVLAYLARVMAGEEPVDPTPEPLPTGRQAWPEAYAGRLRSAPPAGEQELLENANLELDAGIQPAEPEFSEDQISAERDLSLEVLPAEEQVRDDLRIELAESEAGSSPGDLQIPENEVGLETHLGLAEDLAVEEHDYLEESERVRDIPAEDLTNVPLETPLTAPLEGLPLVSYGLLLRSHINASALTEAQVAVGRALNDGVPVAPTAFLLRAAAKAWEREPVNDEEVLALAVLGAGGLGAKIIPDAATMPFAELLERVSEVALSQDLAVEKAGLLVADMSGYDIDEAVLHAGMPVLALGRIVPREGRYESTLSLSGEIPPENAARFLGRVAKLLTSPVELVV